MSKERLYLFDTTLRDGAQTTGVDFSLEDKRLIAKTLDELGVDYIEGGYPGANVTDTELFSIDLDLKHAVFTAFGMTKRAGRWVVLCDTNGGTLPHEVSEIVAEVATHVPGTHLGIHTHNDTENAVANTLAAVRAGARQIQGALNGLGERCGNANLVSIIPTLLLKSEFADRFVTQVTPQCLEKLTHASRLLDELLNRAPNRQAPYVGEAAFATKAGIHASAILKEPATYEHVVPGTVGNRRRVLVSAQAGKANHIHELERLGIPL